MDVPFLQSGRFAFLITAFVVGGVGGAKLVFGPDAATRIGELRLANAFPGGEPSASILDRPIVGTGVVTPFGLTLREFLAVLGEYTPTWEPLDERRFVLRLTGTDPLTYEEKELAVRFTAVDGPQDLSIASVFTGPAVYVDNMAYNRVTASPMDLFIVMNTAAQRAHPVR